LSAILSTVPVPDQQWFPYLIASLLEGGINVIIGFPYTGEAMIVITELLFESVAELEQHHAIY
jgi:hypothetical protein